MFLMLYLFFFFGFAVPKGVTSVLCICVGGAALVFCCWFDAVLVVSARIIRVRAVRGCGFCNGFCGYGVADVLLFPVLSYWLL